MDKDEMGPEADKTHVVIIELNQYLPSEMHIKRGDTIIWKNNDNRAHTITWGAAEFENAQLNLDETHTQIFDSKGTYYYFCDYHDSMRGVIYVE